MEDGASQSLLTIEQVEGYLPNWPNWRLTPNSDGITRTLRAENHLSAVAFVHAAVEMADEHDHQPNIEVTREREVTLTLSTTVDDTAGVSPLDFLVAECIDQIPIDAAPPPVPAAEAPAALF